MAPTLQAQIEGEATGQVSDMEHAHVRLSGDRAGEYVVADERPDGTLVIVPDTSWKAIQERSGARPS